MQSWLQMVWKRMTTTRCAYCGARVRVVDFVETGNTRKTDWWAGDEEELACPQCGYTFWVKK